VVVSYERHWQFVGLEEVAVRVRSLFCHGVSELSEGLLRYNTGIGEPFSIGLDSGVWQFSGLEGGRFGDISMGIALRGASFQNVEDLNLFGIAVEILALY
jgi:hypothetical protein